MMLQNLSSRQKIALGVMIIPALAATFFFYLLRPQMDTYGTLKEELQDKRKELQKTIATINSYAAEKEKVEKAREELDKLTLLFEKDFRQGLALVLLGVRTDRYKIKINNLEPEGVVNRGDYLEVPVKLHVSGIYENVLALLSEIEKLPNPVQVCSLQIKPAAGDENSLPVAPGTGVEMQCRLVIYSDTSPAGQLYLEQEIVRDWLVGRENPFSKPGLLSPHPAISTPQVTIPVVPETGSGGSQVNGESDSVENTQVEPGERQKQTAPAGEDITGGQIL